MAKNTKPADSAEVAELNDLRSLIAGAALQLGSALGSLPTPESDDYDPVEVNARREALRFSANVIAPLVDRAGVAT